MDIIEIIKRQQNFHMLTLTRHLKRELNSRKSKNKKVTIITIAKFRGVRFVISIIFSKSPTRMRDQDSGKF